MINPLIIIYNIFIFYTFIINYICSTVSSIKLKDLNISKLIIFFDLSLNKKLSYILETF